MRYFLLLGISLLALTGCATNRYPDVDFENVDNRSNVDVDAFIYSLNVYAVEIEEKYKHRVVFEDSRIFYTNDYVNKIWLKFITQEIAEVWDARKVMVEITEGFLDRINNDIQLKWFAEGCRLNSLNIDVTINYESFMGKYIDPLYVGSANLQDGMVYYYAFDTYDPNTDVWHQRVEPYNKSLLLVNARARAEMPYWNKRKSMQDKVTILSNILTPPTQGRLESTNSPNPSNPIKPAKAVERKSLKDIQ